MGNDTEIIKQKIDVLDYIGRDVPLKKTGINFFGNCPFHNEKSPSFSVSPQRQAWYCFGCHKGGDIINYVMEKEAMEFREALQVLADEAGITLSNTPEKQQKYDDVYALLEAVSGYYEQLLKSPEGKKAKEYMSNERKISDEMLGTFRIGYSPNSWDQTYKHFLQKGYSYKQLELAGLIINKEGDRYYDRFRNRIMFPIQNRMGKVVGFSARSFDSDEGGAKYLNSPETPVFNKSETLYGFPQAKESIYKKAYSIVVEGQLDVISMHQAGITNTVASLGTAFTDKHAETIKRLSNNTLFVFDSDEAGQKATERSVKHALEKTMHVKVANLTSGSDPDDALKKDPEQVKKDLRNTKHFYDYIVGQGKKKIDMLSPQASASLASEVLPFINVIPNQIQRESLIQKLSHETGISIDALSHELTTKSQQKEELPSAQKSKTVPRIIGLWRELGSMLLQIPESLHKDAQLVDQLKETPDPTDDSVSAKIAIKLRDMVINDGLIDQSEFDKSLSEDEEKLVNFLSLRNLGIITDSDDDFLHNLRNVIRDITLIQTKHELSSLTQFNAQEKLHLTDEERSHRIAALTETIRNLQ